MEDQINIKNFENEEVQHYCVECTKIIEKNRLHILPSSGAEYHFSCYSEFYSRSIINRFILSSVYLFLFILLLLILSNIFKY